jgi:kumamolisin
MPKIAAVAPYIKFPTQGVHPRAAGAGPWTIAALAAAYQWPKNAPGGGVIGIVELGGGWVQSDLDAYFASIGQPVPHVTDVSVDRTTNTPDPSANSADYEVALDIEVAAAAYYLATGKAATVRVYWAQDIATAVRAAAKDGCAVCSISWGAPETQWGNAAVADMEAAAAAATAAGMIVFAASGDNDADDGAGNPVVDCPACCPHVVGCGGTSKVAGGIESVWNNDPNPTDPSGEGTGGGYSTIFPVQPWQVGAPAGGTGRMVPDVAADADPNTGYEIYCHGASLVIGGTSAVAPLYAGLFASFGKGLGNVNPTLWKNHAAFSDITAGGNGGYQAGIGPDPCTGLGSPIGAKLEALFVAVAPPAPGPTPPPPTPPPAPPAFTYAVALAAVTSGLNAGHPIMTRHQAVALATAALAPYKP